MQIVSCAYKYKNHWYFCCSNSVPVILFIAFIILSAYAKYFSLWEKKKQNRKATTTKIVLSYRRPTQYLPIQFMPFCIYNLLLLLFFDVVFSFFFFFLLLLLCIKFIYRYYCYHQQFFVSFGYLFISIFSIFFSSFFAQMAATCWWYYIAKFTEFFDTFFFNLRKKTEHVSTLHVIHHGCMPFSVWLGLKFAPGNKIEMKKKKSIFIFYK